MKITHTITVLELIWTIIAACGFLFMVLLLWRSYKDKEWLINSHANGNHDLRLYVANTSFLIFAGGAFTQMSYLLVGAIAMTQPSLGGHPHPAQIVSSSIFIAASLMGTVLAGVIYNRRTKVVKLIAERLAKENHG